jgi:hypothetical protein
MADTKANGRNGGQKKKTVKVELVPSLQPKGGRIYSNFMQISHSPWDFTVRFCDAPPGGNIPRTNKDLKFEIPNLVEIIIPVNVMPGLIGALQTHLEKYEKAYGKKTETTR